MARPVRLRRGPRRSSPTGVAGGAVTGTAVEPVAGVSAGSMAGGVGVRAVGGGVLGPVAGAALEPPVVGEAPTTGCAGGRSPSRDGVAVGPVGGFSGAAESAARAAAASAPAAG